MGSLLHDCTWIVGLPNYRVVAMERQPDGRLVIAVERRGMRRYACSGCARRTGRVREAKERTWDDLPWAEHPVTLRYSLRRLWCRHCGIRTERVDFADSHARLTRRFRQRIGLDCQSMPTSHAAVRHAVSWSRARRAERAFLEAWDGTRPKYRPDISAPTRSNAERVCTFGPSCRTWCVARSSAWPKSAARTVSGRC
jgi:transposase